MARAPITCVSYNMLAASLGSNTIPWVMTIDPTAVAEAEQALRRKRHEHEQQQQEQGGGGGENRTPTVPSSWEEFQHKILGGEYRSKFHSNYSPVWPRKESYWMRSTWAIEVNSVDDLPAILQNTVTVSEPNHLHWVDEEGGTGEPRSGWTLCGVLVNHFGQDLGSSLYRSIMFTEKSVYSWKTRGPKMLRRILDFPFPPSGNGDDVDRGGPSLVGFQEYDTEKLMLANYGTGSGTDQTFREAMVAHGYCGVFFNSPNGSQSLAAYFRADRFEIDAAHNSYTTIRGRGGDGAAEAFALHDLKAGESIADAAFCFDLHCTWHPKNKESGKYSESAEMLPKKQRRSAGMVRLISKDDPSRKVWVVVVHLMTTSRDAAKTNGYPGEVRAGELAELRKHVAKHVQPGEAVLLMGDFNTQPTDLAIFAGTVPAAKGSVSGQAHVLFDTGFKKLGTSRAQLDWLSGDTAGSGGAVLTDAFEATHGWGDEGTIQPTSVSAARSDHIDYMFYDARRLKCTETVLQMPSSATPNTVEPSDHMPIGARFTWAAPHVVSRGAESVANVQESRSSNAMAALIVGAFAAVVYASYRSKL